jgi:hypothetical protein
MDGCVEDGVEDPSDDGARSGADPKNARRSPGAELLKAEPLASLSLAEASGLNGFSSELESSTSRSRDMDDFPG